jgi:hypothetical protein
MISNDNRPSDGTNDQSDSDSTGTATGTANVNAVYPGSPNGPPEVTDADVSDMNADSASQTASDDAVPGVRS